ncbi:MAG: hypothetical protein ACPLPW_07685 [bacterium]
MNFIGIDVGKQELVAYDGKSQRSFPNTPELWELRAFLQDYGKEVTLTFEPTSTYSRFLEMLCAKEGIPSWRLNPRVLPHLREMEERRSQNDRTDCELLFLYGEKKARIAAAHKLLLIALPFIRKGCLTTLPTQERVNMKTVSDPKDFVSLILKPLAMSW